MGATSKSTPQRWVKVAVDYYRNPKVITAGIHAEVAYIRLLAMARERVETSTRDGDVPWPLVNRELRDVADSAGSTVHELCEALESVGLVSLSDHAVTIDDYERWQTTRAEIENARETARTRAATRSARAKQGGGADPKGSEPEARHRAKREAKQPEEAEEMGVYDERVPPFKDLREATPVRAGKKLAGKHGLDPRYADQVEQVAAHTLATRRGKLGATRAKTTQIWRSSIQQLLKGDTAAGITFTAGQLCDLFDFAADDTFWRAYACTPEGFVRNAHKMWFRAEYADWSVAGGRPEANRPEGGGNRRRRPKGTLAADMGGDYKSMEEEWE